MTIDSDNYNLVGRFSQKVIEMPEAPALWLEGSTFSYTELGDLTRRVRAQLDHTGPRTGVHLEQGQRHTNVVVVRGRAAAHRMAGREQLQ